MSVDGVGSARSLYAASQAGSQQSMTMSLNKLYSQMDPQGVGSVDRAQFDSSRVAAANTIKADDLFTKLDPEGKGVVSREEFIAGMKQLIGKNRSNRGAAVSYQSSSPEKRSDPAASQSASAAKPLGVNRPSSDGPTGRSLNLYA